MSEVTGTTRIVGLVGDPIAHSLSPVMHNAAYERLGLDWVYVALPAPAPASAQKVFEVAHELGFVGLNVTMPYKPLAVQSAGEVDASAEAVGGANTLLVKDGLLRAYNTDGEGIVASLANDGELKVSGSRVVVLGTGPTATAATHALVRAGAAEVTVVSRDLSRSTRVISSVRDGGKTKLVALEYVEAGPAVVTADAIVNATSLGMRAGDGSPLVREWLQPHHIILDVVYGTPMPTVLLTDARAAGAHAFDGLGMLVEQGALSLEIFASLPAGQAPRGLMRAVAEKALAAKRRHAG